MRKFKLLIALMALISAQIAVATPASAVSCIESWQNSGYAHDFDFSGCDLTNATFGENDLSGANFTNANLTQAWLAGKNLTGANLTGANLYGADVRSSNFTNANLTRANFTGARFITMNSGNPPTVRFHASFIGANLTEANFTRGGLLETDFTNATLTRANFVGASLKGSHGTGIVGTPVGLSSLNKITNGTWISIDYVAPTLTGTMELGKSLKATPSNYYDPTTVWTYQWFRDAAAIPKATKSNYVLTTDDCGTQIKVTISGLVQSFSINDTPSPKLMPTCVMKPTKPKLTGTPKVKQSIKAVVSAWVKGAEITYQWLLDGQPIEGAISPKFSILSSHKGHKLALAVTQSRFGFEAVTATTAAVTVK